MTYRQPPPPSCVSVRVCGTMFGRNRLRDVCVQVALPRGDPSAAPAAALVGWHMRPRALSETRAWDALRGVLV